MDDWYHKEKLKDNEIGKTYKNEVGNRYKTFTVIKLIREHGKIYWLCKCDCGFEKVVYGNRLRNNTFRGCKCDPLREVRKFQNHEGENHYMWHIKERIYNNKKGIYHRCVCECGNESVVEVKGILNGKSKCCGCSDDNNIKYYTLRIRKHPYDTAAVDYLFGLYKRGAIRRGIIFELNKQEFKALLKDKCTYCGSEPYTVLKLKRKSEEDRGYLYNGIDRIDNNTGYITSNVVSCCKKCNLMKHILIKDDFLTHVDLISNYQKSKALCQSA